VVVVGWWCRGGVCPTFLGCLHPPDHPVYPPTTSSTSWALFGHPFLRLTDLGARTDCVALGPTRLEWMAPALPEQSSGPASAAWFLDHVTGLLGKRLAHAVALQVDTYARPGKLLGLQHEDVVPPTRSLGPTYQRWGIVFAPSTRRERTKTGQQDDSLDVRVW
jgi:hypothetical protein